MVTSLSLGWPSMLAVGGVGALLGASSTIDTACNLPLIAATMALLGESSVSETLKTASALSHLLHAASALQTTSALRQLQSVVC